MSQHSKMAKMVLGRYYRVLACNKWLYTTRKDRQTQHLRVTGAGIFGV